MTTDLTPIRRQLESIELELNQIDDHRQLADRTTDDLSATAEDHREQIDQLWGMVHRLLNAQTELVKVIGQPARWG